MTKLFFHLWNSQAVTNEWSRWADPPLQVPMRAIQVPVVNKVEEKRVGRPATRARVSRKATEATKVHATEATEVQAAEVELTEVEVLEQSYGDPTQMTKLEWAERAVAVGLIERESLDRLLAMQREYPELEQWEWHPVGT